MRMSGWKAPKYAPASRRDTASKSLRTVIKTSESLMGHLLSDRLHPDQGKSDRNREPRPAEVTPTRCPSVADRAGAIDGCARENDGGARLLRAHCGHKNQKHAHGQPGDNAAMPNSPKKQANSMRFDARGGKQLGLAEISVHESGRDAQNTGTLNQEIAHLHTSIHKCMVLASRFLRVNTELYGTAFRSHGLDRCGLACACPLRLHRAQG